VEVLEEGAVKIGNALPPPVVNNYVPPPVTGGPHDVLPDRGR
jgi:hypothetical protein